MDDKDGLKRPERSHGLLLTLLNDAVRQWFQQVSIARLLRVTIVISLASKCPRDGLCQVYQNSGSPKGTDP